MVDLCEFKASLVHRVSSRTARATYKNLSWWWILDISKPMRVHPGISTRTTGKAFFLYSLVTVKLPANKLSTYY